MFRRTATPTWEVNIPNYCGDDDWKEFRGWSPEEAAVAAGEDYDNGDYTLLKGEELTVLVREPGQPETAKRYTVTGETQPHYYAREDGPAPGTGETTP